MPAGAARSALLLGTFHLLHGLPRRTRKAEARARTPDAFLSHALGGRRAWRTFRGRRRAASLPRPLRIAHRARRLRRAAGDRSAPRSLDRISQGVASRLARERRARHGSRRLTRCRRAPPERRRAPARPQFLSARSTCTIFRRSAPTPRAASSTTAPSSTASNFSRPAAPRSRPHTSARSRAPALPSPRCARKDRFASASSGSAPARSRATGETGDHYTFYDIDPLVIQVAHSEFDFLRESKAQIEIVPAMRASSSAMTCSERLSLERTDQAHWTGAARLLQAPAPRSRHQRQGNRRSDFRRRADHDPQADQSQGAYRRDREARLVFGA